MRTLKTRYGASLPLTISIDDPDAVTATIIIGLAGQDSIFQKTEAFVDGVADLSLYAPETQIPLGTYSYQINVDYADSRVDKYPTASSCDTDGFPEFIVLEALDVTEIS